MRLLLVLVLMLMQLQTWSPLPLYLCICSSGGICLDHGPESCGCCSGECREHTSCCNLAECGAEEDESDGDKHEQLFADSMVRNVTVVVSESHCCTHILVSHPSQATTAVAASRVDVHKLTPVTHCLSRDQFLSGTRACDFVGLRELQHFHSRFAAQSVLASGKLRC